MNSISSGSCKKNADDTRNNWVTIMFVTLIPVRMLSESWNGLVLRATIFISRLIFLRYSVQDAEIIEVP